MNNTESLRVLQNFLHCMPKLYRKRHDNAAVVRDILLAGTSTAGRTSCIALCRELEIDPYGYELEGKPDGA